MNEVQALERFRKSFCNKYFSLRLTVGEVKALEKMSLHTNVEAITNDPSWTELLRKGLAKQSSSMRLGLTMYNLTDFGRTVAHFTKYFYVEPIQYGRSEETGYKLLTDYLFKSSLTNVAFSIELTREEVLSIYSVKNLEVVPVEDFVVNSLYDKGLVDKNETNQIILTSMGHTLFDLLKRVGL